MLGLLLEIREVRNRNLLMKQRVNTFLESTSP